MPSLVLGCADHLKEGRDTHGCLCSHHHTHTQIQLLGQATWLYMRLWLDMVHRANQERGMKLLKVGKVGPTSLENKLESFHCAQVCTQDVTDS